MTTVLSGRDVPGILRAAWPTHTAKRAARAADVPVETSRNWLRGRGRPLAETLLRMAERNDALRAALIRRLEAMHDATPPGQMALPLDREDRAVDLRPRAQRSRLGEGA